MSTNKLPNWLQQAVNQLGNDCMGSGAAIEAIHAVHAGHVAALARIAELEIERDALRDELNEWRFTNGVDVMRRELDRLRTRMAEIKSQNPVAWVRYASDGIIHGPLLDAQIEDVLRASWTPLISAEWANRDYGQQKEVS